MTGPAPVGSPIPPAADDPQAAGLGPAAHWPAPIRSIVDAIALLPVPVLALWGPEGRATYNEAFATLAGAHHPGLMGAGLAAVWPDAAGIFGPLLDAGLRGQALRRTGQRLGAGRPGQPETVVYDIVASPVLGPNGEPLGVVCLLADATAPLVAARPSRDPAPAVPGTAREIAWTADAAGRVLEIGPGFAALTGTDGTLAGKAGWFGMAHPDDREQMVDGFATATETGQAYDVEHRFRVADGTFRWMRSRAHAWRDGDGRLAGWHGVTVEIVPRKSLELRQSLLLALADEFRASSRPRDIVGTALAVAGREIGANRVAFGDVDLARDSVTFDASWSDGSVERKRGSVPLARLAAGADGDLKQGLAVVLNDRPAGAKDGGFGAKDAGFDAKDAGLVDGEADLPAAIVAPLLRDGRLRALFVAEAERPRDWPPGDVTLLEEVAARAWDAVERAQAAEVLRRNQMRQGFLLVLGDRLRELDDAGEIMQTVAESIGQHLRLDRSGYGEIVAGDEVVFDTGWSAGALEPLVGRFALRILGPENIADLHRGLTTTVERSDAMVPPAAAMPILQGLATLVAVPLIRDGLLRGILTLGRLRNHRWSAEEVALAGEAAARLWEALERTRAEAALRGLNATLEDRVVQRTLELTSSDTRFRTLFETAPAPIFLVRVGPGDLCVFDAVNAATERFIGSPADAIIGMPVERTTSGGDLMLEACLACARSGQPADFEISVEAGSDRRIAECVLAPLPIDNADTQLLIGIARDITAQRQAEDQLRQAQKMEAIGQLTGGIAHDFNNLLTGIIGSLALMEKRLAQGRYDAIPRYAELAMASANRAAALTHRLLAFSRRQPLEAKTVDVDALVRSMDDLLRRTLGESVRLITIDSPEGWLTSCDPHQLENALLNLAINGRDAMPDGGRLTVETSNVDVDAAFAAREPGIELGHYVVLSVSDSGTGMTPDVIARAFDPFFTTKPIGQGTGLGLSMIYGFAKQSEGHVKILSEVGHGTTVQIFLPRQLVKDDAAPSEPADVLPRAEAGETVLVVEDDSTVRGLVLEVLQELGYTAVEAIDGPSGLAVLQSAQRLDLLVTDVGLPGMNGRQLADFGRAQRPGLKVLFITGYAENATFETGHLESDMYMMTKPFAVDDLATRIRTILRTA